MAEVKTCTTCRYSEFDMTNGTRPRPKRDQRGSCHWPVPAVPVLPLSITERYGYSPQDMFRKSGIWPKLEGCPVWTAKEKD